MLRSCNFVDDITEIVCRVTRIQVCRCMPCDGIRKIEWTVAKKQKLKEIKRRLLERSIVLLTDVQRNFILETEASTVAVGTVYKHQFSDTKLENSVAFFGRVLSQSKQN